MAAYRKVHARLFGRQHNTLAAPRRRNCRAARFQAPRPHRRKRERQYKDPVLKHRQSHQNTEQHPAGRSRCRLSERAAPLGEKRRSRATSSTRSRVASRTGALALRTRDTVATDTPASRATSRMVTCIPLPGGRATRSPASGFRRRENVYMGRLNVKGHWELITAGRFAYGAAGASRRLTGRRALRAALRETAVPSKSP